jgi:hypothetical protein
MSAISNSDHINKVLEQYERKRALAKIRYHLVKDSDEFKLKNRQRAKDHYDKNKSVKKDRYAADSEYLKAKAQFNYYKKNDKLDFFIDKYPDRMDMINQRTQSNIVPIAEHT